MEQMQCQERRNPKATILLTLACSLSVSAVQVFAVDGFLVRDDRGEPDIIIAKDGPRPASRIEERPQAEEARERRRAELLD